MINVVCGIIEDSAGNFLVCRRPSGKHLGGLWEFPGGKINPDETAQSALIRELHEELMIDVSVASPLIPVVWHYESLSIRLIPFLCKIVNGIPTPVEHDEIQWLPLQSLASLQWAPADLPILAELNERFAKPAKSP